MRDYVVVVVAVVVVVVVGGGGDGGGGDSLFMYLPMCVGYVFGYALPSVVSSFAIILTRKESRLFCLNCIRGVL